MPRWSPPPKDPSPSSAKYDVATSIEKAQWPKSKEFGFGSSARTSFVKLIHDKALKKDPAGVFKHKSPGVGAYQTDKAFTKVSGSSPLMKTKRH